MALLPPLWSHSLPDHTGLIWEMDPCLALVPCSPQPGTPISVPILPKVTNAPTEPPRTRSFREQMPQAEGVFSTAGVQKLLCYNFKQDRS